MNPVIKGRNYLFIVLFEVFSLTSQLFAQPISFPQLVLSDYKLIVPGSGLAPFIQNVSFNMELTAEQRQAFAEMINDVQEFKQRFEEKRQELENEFQTSSGDIKIQKALNLIKFILEAQKEWELLTNPVGDMWHGDYNMTIDAMGLLHLESQGDAKIDLQLQADSSFGLKELNGSIDGNVKFNLNLSIAGTDVINGQGEYSYNDKLKGYSNFGFYKWLTTQEFIANEGYADITVILPGVGAAAHSETHGGQSSTDVVLIAPFGYGEVHGDDNIISGYIVYIDPYTGMYIKQDINKPVNKTTSEQLLEFTYIEPQLEEIDFQKYKDTYFKYYVNTIDAVREDQFNGLTDMAALEEKGQNTINEIITADRLGQIIGVSDYIFDVLLLHFNTVGSLYDKWFRLWFIASDNKWVELISLSANLNNKIDNLKGRLNNVLKFLNSGETIASEELMIELELFNGSDFISWRIKEYFQEANQKYCTELSNNNITVSEYLQWYSGIKGVAEVFGDATVVSLINVSKCPV